VAALRVSMLSLASSCDVMTSAPFGRVG